MDGKVPERCGRRSVARGLVDSGIMERDESGKQPFRKIALGDRSGGGLDFRSIPDQEGSEDSIGIHGFQRIGHDGVEIFSDKFRPRGLQKACSRLEGEAHPGSRGVVDLRQTGQEIGYRLEVEGMSALRTADLLGGTRPPNGAKVRHGRGHHQEVVGRPANSEFPFEVYRGLEPNFGNSRMWARIDGPRASKKRDQMSEIPGGPGQFRSQAA